MQLSDFSPFGLLEFGAEQSPAETIYRSYVDLSPPGAIDDPHQEASFYARAIGQAISAVTLQRAENQSKVRKASELIHLLERDYEVEPLPTDTLSQRQGRLCAVAKLSSGNAGGNFHAALRDLLGADFLGLYVAPPESVETWPATVGAAPTHCADVRVPPREVVLGLPIGLLSTPIEVPYSNLDPNADEQLLVAGDVVVVDAGNTGLAEKVTIASVAGTVGARTLTATFTKPHDDATIATTADWPMLVSTKRFVYVIVTASIATDPVRRAQIDALCLRLRAATQWAIVAPSTPGSLTVGPMVLGETTPLGTAPIEPFTFMPS